MKKKELIEGVCCKYCSKFESDDCPVKTASPWSRWDYCNHFRDGNGKTIVGIIQEQSK